MTEQETPWRKFICEFHRYALNADNCIIEAERADDTEMKLKIAKDLQRQMDKMLNCNAVLYDMWMEQHTDLAQNAVQILFQEASSKEKCPLCSSKLGY